MSTVEHEHSHSPAPVANVPPLRHGDRLSRDEFERRYAALPDIKKAELIEGVVYMPSPVRFKQHAQPHMDLIAWIGYYRSKTPGLGAGDNATSRLGGQNEPQPDIMLFLPRHAGGSVNIDGDDYVSGPPELICEVAASTKSIDLGVKKTAYCRYGVKEYLVWRVEERAIDWFELHDGNYRPLRPTDDGILCSNVFPGLWLNVEALLKGNLPQLFATIDQGTATEEHRAFVERLQISTD